jgi:hypothetical protein
MTKAIDPDAAKIGQLYRKATEGVPFDATGEEGVRYGKAIFCRRNIRKP